MRYRANVLFVLGIMLVAAVSCVDQPTPPQTPEVPEQPQPVDPTVLSFKAGREPLTSFSGPAVRTSFVNDTQLHWDLYDKLIVFDGESEAGCLAITEQSGLESLFVTAAASLDSEKYLIASPYSENLTVSYETCTAQFTIPATQVADECGADMDYAYALAKGGREDREFTFKNAFAVVKVAIAGVADGMYSHIELDASGAYVAGTYTVDYSAETLTAGAVSSGTSVITFNSEESALSAGSYYILVAPGSYPDGLKATVVSGQGGEDVELLSDGAVTLAPGQICDLGKAYTPGFKALFRLPYCISILGNGTDNQGVYVDVTRGGDTSIEYDMYLSDKEDNGVYLHCKEAGSASFAASTTALKYKAHTRGEIRGKHFVTDQDSYYKLIMPVAFDMPSSINVTFGAYAKNAYQKWQLLYSKDDKNYRAANNGFNFCTANNRYEIINVRIDFPSDFSVTDGDILYLKLIPRPTNQYILGGGNEIWNKDHAIWLWGGVAVTPIESRNTPVPSDAVYFEAFDTCNGGVDYLLGDDPSGRAKLGTLANAHGAAVTSLNGLLAEHTVERPGYVQLGHPGANWTYLDNPIVCGTGKVTTPTLGTSGNLVLSFKAVAYRTTITESNAFYDGMPGSNTIIVNIIGGGTFEDGTTTRNISVSEDEWDTLTYPIESATAGTQIEFTSPSSATTTRWFLDEIYVRAQ